MKASMKFIGVILTLVAIQLGAAQTEEDQPANPLRLVQTLKVPDFTFSTNLTLDSKRNRALAAARGSNELLVIDLTNGNIIQRIPSLGQPQGILYLPESDLIVIASGGAGRCLFYGADDFKLRKTVEGKPLAKCLWAEPDGRAILLGYDKSVCTIDPKTFEVTSNAVVDEYPVDVIAENSGKRAFAILPRNNIVAVIDRATGTVTAQWPVPDGNSSRLALDEANHRLLVACNRPGRLVVFDTDSGSVVSTIPIIGNCSYLTYDEAEKRVYAVCAAGTIDVFTQLTPDKYRLDERIPTGPATSGWHSPEQQRLYILAPPGRGPEQQQGELTVYDTAGNKASAPTPGDSPK